MYSYFRYSLSRPFSIMSNKQIFCSHFILSFSQVALNISLSIDFLIMTCLCVYACEHVCTVFTSHGAPVIQDLVLPLAVVRDSTKALRSIILRENNPPEGGLRHSHVDSMRQSQLHLVAVEFQELKESLRIERLLIAWRRVEGKIPVPCLMESSKRAYLMSSEPPKFQS